ncbi:MAG: DJ-1/PfpI family protein [Candidatus Heimdallarchaeota archaeon]|nr:DJ-1/PfpI family protein [Candidatus Heimdallarchaeota archaeon]
MSFRDIKLIDVGVIVFDDVDFLDFVGPIEVFNAAQIPNPDTDPTKELESMYDSIPMFNTKLVSVYPQEYITTGDGTKVVPDYSISLIENEKTFNPLVWVVPGGKGIHTIRKDDDFISWLRLSINAAHLTLSVCTGNYAVAQTGIIENEMITTHWRHYNIFQHEFPDINLANNVRYTETAKIVSAGGISCGIDGALRVVSRLLSEEVAQRVADRIVYPWMD